jgi:H+-translocating NAD(P) transhydrogenase subunit alpha
MHFQFAITGFVALYIFMLAGFGGWVIIGNVPAILHTPLMSGSNFVHGIVVVGAIFAMLNAVTPTQQVIGFFAVLLGAGNAAGGYAVTDRMLAMFKTSGHASNTPRSTHARRAKARPPEESRKNEDAHNDRATAHWRVAYLAAAFLFMYGLQAYVFARDRAIGNSRSPVVGMLVAVMASFFYVLRAFRVPAAKPHLMVNIGACG